jgi:hypothetical protein
MDHFVRVETGARPQKKRLLTFEEYAAEHRISVSSARREAKRGELTLERPSPGRVFIVVAAEAV